MWGFRNQKNRYLARQIADKIMHPDIAKQYNFDKNRKGDDQTFLGRHVYEFIKKNSIIHDSYHCKHYQDSDPFPTKRNGSCYVATYDKHRIDCEKQTFTVCPLECRPKDHIDLIYC